MCTRTVHVQPAEIILQIGAHRINLTSCPLPLLATPHSSLEMLFGIGPSSNQHKRPRTPLSKKSDSKTSIATSTLGKDQSDSEMPPSPAISKLKEVVEDVYEEIKSLKEELKSVEEEAAKWKAQNATTEASLEARGKYTEQLNLELTKTKSDRGRLQKDFERLSGELDSVRKERDRALQECGKFQAETDAVKKEWNKAQQERLRLQKRSDSLKRERDAFEKQYETLAANHKAKPQKKSSEGKRMYQAQVLGSEVSLTFESPAPSTIDHPQLTTPHGIFQAEEEDTKRAPRRLKAVVIAVMGMRRFQQMAESEGL